MNLLDQLRQPSDTRLAVRVSADALRQIRAGHPWLWDRSIERVSHPAATGDLAVVFDAKRKFVGIGLFDAESPIAVRMLHVGSPRQIDADFFVERLVAALDRRASLLDDPDTTGLRLVHGENDRLPGFVADLYDTTLVVRLDTAAWVPHLSTVLPPLVELASADRVVLRAGRTTAPRLPAPLGDGVTILGEQPRGPVPFVENGLEFRADVEAGQKTGHFLDQRENRRLAGLRSADAGVIDVFSNTGGFTLAALASGARSVLSVDIDPHAIDAVHRNVALNRALVGFAGDHDARVGDAFEVLEMLIDQRVRFDVVVIDPPSFAPNEAAVASARRAYRRLTRLGVELLQGGGTLVQASCSSRIDETEFNDLVADEIDRAGYRPTNIMRTAHPIDHPVGFPQGAYLKAVFVDLVPRD